MSLNEVLETNPNAPRRLSWKEELQNMRSALLQVNGGSLEGAEDIVEARLRTHLHAASPNMFQEEDRFTRERRAYALEEVERALGVLKVMNPERIKLHQIALRILGIDSQSPIEDWD